jgi:hypothetical protein
MIGDKIPTREAFLITLVLTSATIIVVAFQDKGMATQYFDILKILIGGILGFATQSAIVGRDK